MAQYQPSAYRIGSLAQSVFTNKISDIDSIRNPLSLRSYHIPAKSIKTFEPQDYEHNPPNVELVINKSNSEICLSELDYPRFSDNIQDSDYPSSCTCWDEMTSPRLNAYSCNTIGLIDDGNDSLESGIGEVDYESDVFEAGMDERGDFEEIVEVLNDKLVISPTSSTETKLLSRSSSTQSYNSLKYTTSIILPSHKHADVTRQIPFFKQSMFYKFPPTINFPLPNECIDHIPANIETVLKWRPSTITPVVVKSCIAKAGFRMSNSKDWIGYFGKHMKAATFKSIKPFQKVNHLPGSFHMGRKDSMWKSIIRMQARFSKKEFDFVPQTFILPAEYEAFKHDYESKGSKARWIMKPPASARGIGVQMVKKFNLVPRNRSILVQQYISNPMLINDSKCDLRIYVYITSMDPLRLYIYDDGLVRFATVKYSTATRHLSNRFVHLTNYSVNKKNKNFQANTDETVRQGHKWGLKALWPYLAER
ncbi:hypothetical protein LOD99_662 [Oopsacas minuta]|uniref:Tubulin polyglutamylase TTLL4 n=1 Tax=Oopsacas minuta TaxID=111878 RepID=A0AAV7K010_9METZ|nr:hypothetical protein LOD99_662 [Oopsacas minuta]